MTKYATQSKTVKTVTANICRKMVVYFLIIITSGCVVQGEGKVPNLFSNTGDSVNWNRLFNQNRLQITGINF